MKKTALKIVFTLIVSWLLFRFWLSFYPLFLKLLHSFSLVVLIVSLACGLIIGFVSIKFDFYRSLEHELSHVIMALLMFRKPSRLLVDNGKGEAVYSGESNVVISTAPYFLPLTALFFATLSFIAKGSIKPYLIAFIITAIVYHLVSIIFEFFQGQSDLKQHNTVFALSVTAFLFTLVLSGLMIVALNGFSPVAGAYKLTFYSLEGDVKFFAGLLADLGKDAFYFVVRR